MSQASSRQAKLEDGIANTLRQVHPFIEDFARFGFAVKGLVYVIVAIFAGLAPIGMTSRPLGTSGALRILLQNPAGFILLIIVAGGLTCFGLWQLLRAIADPEFAGKSWRGLFLRISWIGNAIVNFAFVAIAVGLMIGIRRATSGNDDRSTQDWTAWAMGYPFGRWVVAIIGVSILGFGIGQFCMGIIGRLDPRLSMATVSKTSSRWLRGISRFGVAARGIVFVLVGLFLLNAAYQANAHDAHALSGTLSELSHQPFGAWLLGLTALGLAAYGFYDFVLARYRRIRIP